MKAITVQDQVRLGPRRCLSLTMSGMSYRLFRSSITVAILALAVAFLAHMVSYSLVSHRSRVLAWEELSDSRRLGAWITRLTVADPAASVIRSLADEGDRRGTYRAWALDEGVSAEGFERATKIAADLVGLWGWFERLPAEHRVVLLPVADVRVGVRRMAEAEGLDRFEKRLADLDREPPLGSMAAVRQLLLEDRSHLDRTVAAVRAGHRGAIGRIEAAFPDTEPRDLIAELPEGFLAELETAGFTVDEAVMRELSAQARDNRDRSRLARLLQQPGVAQKLRGEGGFEAASVDTLAVIRWLTSSSRAELLHRAIGEPTGLGPDRLLALAVEARRQNRLRTAVGDRPPREESGPFGLPVRTRWLIVVSFLVCVVGVANAMFMSVTERFAEIATMKCLGALDTFIMMMFLFESMIQGLIGAAVGVTVGYLLALVRGGADYGGLMFEAMPLTPLAIGAGLSVVVGILLAAFAAIGPAWLAARLAPMEAMRIE